MTEPINDVINRLDEKNKMSTTYWRDMYADLLSYCRIQELQAQQSETTPNTAAEVKAAFDEASTRLGAYAAEPVAALREKMLCRALQQSLTLLSNRCRLILYEEHGEILRWLQGVK